MHPVIRMAKEMWQVRNAARGKKMPDLGHPNVSVRLASPVHFRLHRQNKGRPK